MIVIDEQHRFGVRQREALSAKGDRPHVLVMSATPIPRTLALMLYGEMCIRDRKYREKSENRTQSDEKVWVIVRNPLPQEVD